MKIEDQNHSVIEELKTLSLSIKEMRKEILKLQTETSRGFEFTDTHNELDAVIESAAIATNTIIDKLEIIEQMKDFVEKPEQSKLQELVTHMYEACSFQDISGQRIRKVIHIIHVIENTLEEIFKHYDALLNLEENSEDIENKTEELNYEIVKDLYALSVKLTQTKSEISLIQSAQHTQIGFQIAQTELDEVSRAASQATFTILTCAETLENRASYVSADYRPIYLACITRIYEACSFHDLIGQRLSKVMAGLTKIDLSLKQIFKEYGAQQDHASSSTTILENGPQLPLKAPTQDMIDAIFKNALKD